MSLQTSGNVWTFEHTHTHTFQSTIHLRHFQRPNWIPITENFQAFFYIQCCTPSPLHLLPILFSQYSYLSSTTANGIREQRWLKKKPFFLHYFSTGSTPWTALPHRFYRRMQWIVQGWEKEARQKALIKQHHWMGTQSLGGATILNRHSGYWFVTSVPVRTPWHVIADYCPITLSCWSV